MPLQLKATDETYIAALGADMSATTKEVSEKQKKLETLIDSDKGKELLAKVATARKTYVDAAPSCSSTQKGRRRCVRPGDSDLRPWPRTTSSRLKTSPSTPTTSWLLLKKSVLSSAETSPVGAGDGRGASLVLGLLFAVWATRSITTPVQRAVEAAEEISKGNLSLRIDAQGKDEAARLCARCRRCRKASRASWAMCVKAHKA